MGIQAPGCHQLVFDAIQMCETEDRKALFGNVVLSGGTTMFKGFTERLTKEVSQLQSARGPGQSGFSVVANENNRKNAGLVPPCSLQ